MKKNESITRLMTKDLVTANYSDQFSSIKKQMDENNIHHVPVVDSGQLVGIISRTDILSNSHSRAYVGTEKQIDSSLDHAIPVKELMTKDPIALKSTDTVKHAVEILNSHSFNSIPVIEADNRKLVGMVTTKDLMSYLIGQY